MAVKRAICYIVCYITQHTVSRKPLSNNVFKRNSSPHLLLGNIFIVVFIPSFLGILCILLFYYYSFGVYSFWVMCFAKLFVTSSFVVGGPLCTEVDAYNGRMYITSRHKSKSLKIFALT